jgi:SAM-dependent methyltransferase
MTALLLTCIIGQVALPYTGPVVIEPTFPADAVLHTTECGKTIGIVPEPPASQPAYRTESYTAYVSTCGMGCCVAPVTKQRRVPVGEKTVNDPTPLAEIEEALIQIDLTKDDVLYDLGSGDGRVCIMAATIHGCRAVGLDQRPEAIELSKGNARLNGVEELLRFYERDVFASNLEDATVVFVYLDQSLMGDVAEVLRRYPNISKAISYQHAWPRGGRKVGDFHIWRKQERVAAKPIISRGRS